MLRPCPCLPKITLWTLRVHQAGRWYPSTSFMAIYCCSLYDAGSWKSFPSFKAYATKEGKHMRPTRCLRIAQLLLMAIWFGKHWELSRGESGGSVWDSQPIPVLGRERGGNESPVVFTWGMQVYLQTSQMGCRQAQLKAVSSKSLNSKICMSWQSTMALLVLSSLIFFHECVPFT